MVETEGPVEGELEGELEGDVVMDGDPADGSDAPGIEETLVAAEADGSVDEAEEGPPPHDAQISAASVTIINLIACSSRAVPAYADSRPQEACPKPGP